MTGITSSVGLVSGINTGQIVDQLMAIEQQPVTDLQNRVAGLDTQRTAWMTLSASLLGLQSTATTLKDAKTFNARTVNSSDQTTMTATADSTAALGTYQFTVRRLAQTQQLISGGMTDSDQSAVGAGTLHFDTGYGQVAPSTSLSFLNGQAGVSRGTIRITDRSGNTATVDLSSAATVDDVLSAINSQTDAAVGAQVSNGVIVLHDTSGGSGALTVADQGQGQAAANLGIAGSIAGDTLTGSNVNYISNSTSLNALNDGLGVRRAAGGGDLKFTLSDGTAFTVNLYGTVTSNSDTVDYTAHTIGDVIKAIKLTAAISADGQGLTLTDTSGGGGHLGVENVGTSQAATDLGIEGVFTGTAVGKDLIPKLDSVLTRDLGGTAGMTMGTVSLQDRAGNSIQLDLSGAQSLSDVIEAINNNGTVHVQASLNSAGTGIQIADTSGSTAGNLSISDVTGNVATTLCIAVDPTANPGITQINGGDAKLQYISTATALDKLPGQQTFPYGSFKITSASGATETVTLNSEQTVGDVINTINNDASDIKVSARIDDSGTGIILEDASGGAGQLTVTENGGHTAAALGLLGKATQGQAYLDGSFHRGVDISATDTLQTVAQKINDANLNVAASVINDGSATNPYRMVLSSKISGTAGRVLFDGGTSSLNFTSISDPQDALVYMGSPGAASPVVLTSSTNQLNNAIKGMTFNLVGTSAQPVTVTVGTDVDSIVSQLKSFTTNFNSIVGNINTLTSYDPTTQKAGVLFGDSSIDLVSSRLFNMVMQKVNVSGSYTHLTDVGFSFTGGNQISFDETAFRNAYASDPNDVSNLFTQAPDTIADPTTYKGTMTDQPVTGTGGIGAVYESMLSSLTDSYTGLIARITGSLDDQKTDLNSRITDLNTLLASKRQQLVNEFANMETALAQLESQSSALSALSGTASSLSTTSSSSSTGSTSSSTGSTSTSTTG
jgi:flagellar hook-associated protein 2